MKMTPKQYRIGELAKVLNVERFVIRFWEKELGIKPHRSPGGQRFYQKSDFDKFKLVKELLYEKKFTLAGAKKILLNKKSKSSTTVSAASKVDINQHLKNDLIALKQHLVKLKNLL